MSDCPIALVNMPFGHSKYPSIQLGTLSALLKAHGTTVQSHYLNLFFAQRVGFPLYDVLCESQLLLGEWLFSRLLFHDNPKHQAYLRDFKPLIEETCRKIGCPTSYLEEIEGRIAPQFLTWALTAIDWSRYRLIGFTSMFQQNVASITLAKLIKDLYPEVRIVFGGAHYDGEMGLEYFRAFPWIDYVVVGEGETVLPALVRQVLEGREGEPPPGVAWRKDGQVRFTPNTTLFAEFAQTSPPDYDDYFTQLEEVAPGSFKGMNRILLYEAARGCWWGEKHHCTFCGLNAQSMKFRSKAPEQVRRELEYLSSRYDTTRVRFVDNIIDMKYIDGLFGELAAHHYDLDIFIETKSNLTKQQIRTLAHGGVTSMQPGLESLSADQLREMDKGVSPMQNVVVLKWSRYYNIDLNWNILLGFPGETDEDYRHQIDVIPSLFHLQAPESVGKFWLERFSPYFTRPHQYGVRITGPGAAYDYVYDPAKIDLNRIAYDFEYEIDHKVDPHLYRDLLDAVHGWQRRQAGADKPYLYYAKALNYITVYDGRDEGAATRERYTGAAAFVIDFCNEAPKSFEQIRAHAAQRELVDAENPEALRRVLNDLVSKRVLYSERDKYFTVALPMNAHF
ncbi:RiPP maturation radical SAM C-methyltransferase [Candidatus Nitrospira bockiana]